MDRSGGYCSRARDVRFSAKDMMKAEKPSSGKAASGLVAVILGVVGFNLLATISPRLATALAVATVAIAAFYMLRAILRK